LLFSAGTASSKDVGEARDAMGCDVGPESKDNMDANRAKRQK
jgi:hypothetical protein